MGSEEVREFMLHLILVQKSSANTRRGYLAGLSFLYNKTLRRPGVMEPIPWPKKGEPLPVVLSGLEVQELLSYIRSPKYLALAMLAYGAGLRARGFARASTSGSPGRGHGSMLDPFRSDHGGESWTYPTVVAGSVGGMPPEPRHGVLYDPEQRPHCCRRGFGKPLDPG